MPNMEREIKDNVLMVIVGIAFILNIIFINLFPPIIKELVLVGYIILGIGALFFILSVYTLRRKGTGNVVDTGIYGVVRHPMYIGAIVMFFSHIFFGQNWIVGISTIVGIVCCYLIILSVDQRNIEKFGDEYRRYMQSVPKTNLLLGIVKLLMRRRKVAQPK
jgi:protein-S-isoprenylcysteine O-methyltransferase Ste14